MFKNWSTTQKVLGVIAIVAIIAGIYNWKAIARTLGISTERTIQASQRPLPTCPCPQGPDSPLCCESSARGASVSSNTIPVDVVPSSCGA